MPSTTTRPLEAYRHLRAGPDGLVRKFFTLEERAEQDAEHRLKGVASSSRRDLMGDRIMPYALREWEDGWTRAGRPMLHMLREHNRALVVGGWDAFSCRACEGDEVELDAAGEVWPEMSAAADMMRLRKRGMLKGLSVGMRVRSVSFNRQAGGFDLHKIDIKELSTVIFGANDDATLRSSPPVHQVMRDDGRVDTGAFEGLLATSDLPAELRGDIVAVLSGGRSRSPCPTPRQSPEKGLRSLLEDHFDLTTHGE